MRMKKLLLLLLFFGCSKSEIIPTTQQLLKGRWLQVTNSELNSCDNSIDNSNPMACGQTVRLMCKTYDFTEKDLTINSYKTYNYTVIGNNLIWNGHTAGFLISGKVLKLIWKDFLPTDYPGCHLIETFNKL